MWPRMHFLDLQQLDCWLNGCPCLYTFLYCHTYITLIQLYFILVYIIELVDSISRDVLDIYTGV